MKVKNILALILILIVSCFSVSAQKKTSSKKPVASLKIKPPAMKTYLGIITDSSIIPVDQAKAIIGAPLKVVDDKNNTLTITYYQVLYKRKAVTEDEATGKVTPTISPVSDYFTSTPLPQRWVSIIKESLVPGEELYFFDVVAKDVQGHIYYAPNLKIITK